MKDSEDQPLPNPEINAKPSKYPTHNKTQKSPLKPPIHTKIPQSQQHHKEDIICKPDQTPGWKILLETIGLTTLIVYTIFTALMYVANNKAANAAKDAANTARDALHMSEKAYVVTTGAKLDPAGIVKIPIINVGHIPSGKVQIIIHEATVEQHEPMTAPPNDPQALINTTHPIACKWVKFDTFSVPPVGASGYEVQISIPKFNQESFNSGKQGAIVAGTITYDNGFPNDSTEKWNYCYVSRRNYVLKQIILEPCDWTKILHQMIAGDGYPNNKCQ